MRWILAGLSALAVSACAATPLQPSSAPAPAQSTPERVTSLPPQSLQDGACGVFLFGVGERHPFVVFENERERRALIVHDGAVHELGVASQTGAFVMGQSFSRVYTTSASAQTFTLSGEVAEETGSGPRLTNVLLRVRESDGSETVRPLGGVYSCRQGADRLAASRL
ncbi:hypothetical protein [Oceanicaulis sp.]|uniref:hypothetical protein n=1 Tax=Oceanicaulis sp. TaxID=1924941 RepID=UPI003F6EE368